MTSNHVKLSAVLEEYFGASPVGPLFDVSRIERDPTHPLHPDVLEAFESVTEAEVAEAKYDEDFHGHYGHLPSSEQDWFAREWVVIHSLNNRICERRAISLRHQGETGRPPPYDLVQLKDLVLCQDRMVPLSAFHIEDGVLVRGNHAFTILPPTPSPNSSYWLTRALDSPQVREVARVRLDPLLHGPADRFTRMSYKMLWYGPPLLWEDVRGIETEQSGRWKPASLGNGEFTDFHWSPRGEEVHLAVEEVPTSDSLPAVPSRYFHAIFSRSRDAVIHLDGACRFFSPQERTTRVGTHLRHTGKMGYRVKVFRLDGEIEVGPVSRLGGTFFVWNYDVAQFFGAEIPPSLLGDVR